MTLAVTDHDATLAPDPARVVARLFLPGDGGPAQPRAAQIVDRVLALSDTQIADLVIELTAEFGDRHTDLAALFDEHEAVVASRIPPGRVLTWADRFVIGASFSSEYSVEAAALCNPSPVVHPDQTGLAPGELRVAIALRAIGEGHLSSIGFAAAIIGPGTTWRFEHRDLPLSRARVSEATWTRSHLAATLQHEGRLTELSSAVLADLPESFPSSHVDTVLAALPGQLRRHRDTGPNADALRTMLSSAYTAKFVPESTLSQRVLLPSAVEEDKGMEDARFLRFRHPDGSMDYRATYTAYDGRDVAPRLIISPDLRRFTVHRLSGNASTTKGMAIFPREVAGRQLALVRTRGEDMSLAHSADGLSWTIDSLLYTPHLSWDLVQSGNCGSPIETDRGWLVITHGVGPMRRYSIGAMLLDLDDPSRLLAYSTEPILEASGARQDGYVPNVVYSCGSLVHEGTLWIPYGISDDRIGVCSMGVEALIDSMTPVASA